MKQAGNGNFFLIIALALFLVSWAAVIIAIYQGNRVTTLSVAAEVRAMTAEAQAAEAGALAMTVEAQLATVESRAATAEAEPSVTPTATPEPLTVPLKLYWHPNRQDNVVVATEKSERSQQVSGYSLVRVEGNIFHDPQPGTTPLGMKNK